jgi:hypothetical protein
VTTALTLQQVRDVLAAVAHAERIGLPLNRLVTVHWGAMGVTDADAGRALARVLKLWREALAARGLPFACVWVRENDNGDGSKGSHYPGPCAARRWSGVPEAIAGMGAPCGWWAVSSQERAHRRA